MSPSTIKVAIASVDRDAARLRREVAADAESLHRFEQTDALRRMRREARFDALQRMRVALDEKKIELAAAEAALEELKGIKS